MHISWEEIVFIALLVDSLCANILAWSGMKNNKWYNKRLGLFACYFPLSRGWTTFYLVLVVYIGYLSMR